MRLLNTYQNPKINSLIFKLTDYCNLGCAYCYRGSHLGAPKAVMTDSLIRQVLQKYIFFQQEHGREREPLVVVWHGGEPLTAGLGKFKRILEIENSLQRVYHVEIVNSVQTNGTLLDDPFADFFAENHFVVGFSLDGPKFIQDLYRYDKMGESSFEAAVAGLRRMKERGQKINVISVITNKSAGYVKEIYTFMRNLGIATVDFIPSFYYDTEVTLQPEAYTEFLLGLLALWKEDAFQPLKIRFLNDAYRRVYHRFDHKKMTVECELAGCCGQNFSIGIGGEVYPCECLTPVSSFCQGNIRERTFTDMVRSNAFQQMTEAFNQVSEECHRCDVLDLCRGGCLNRRLPLHNLNQGRDLYCQARKTIFHYMIRLVQEQGFS